MEDRYRKMISDVGSELIDEIEADALCCAFTSTRLPTLKWEEWFSKKVSELVEDILFEEKSLDPIPLELRIQGGVKPYPNYVKSFAFELEKLPMKMPRTRSLFRSFVDYMLGRD